MSEVRKVTITSLEKECEELLKNSKSKRAVRNYIDEVKGLSIRIDAVKKDKNVIEISIYTDNIKVSIEE